MTTVNDCYFHWCRNICKESYVVDECNVRSTFNPIKQRRMKLLQHQSIFTNLNCKPMIIYIKNMISSRCKLKVKSEIEKLGIKDANIQLGKVELSNPISDAQITQLQSALSPCGLEVMQNTNEELVEEIKAVIRQMIDEPVCDPVDHTMTNSEYISKKLGKSYTCLARVFAEETGMSIGQFIISHRIEHTKVLIRQDVLSLSDIAYRLNYSSIGHLSNQFKQTTGISPSVYRKIARNGFKESMIDDRLKPKKPSRSLIASLSGDRLKPNRNANQLSTYKI